MVDDLEAQVRVHGIQRFMIGRRDSDHSPAFAFGKNVADRGPAALHDLDAWRHLIVDLHRHRGVSSREGASDLAKVSPNAIARSRISGPSRRIEPPSGAPREWRRMPSLRMAVVVSWR